MTQTTIKSFALISSLCLGIFLNNPAYTEEKHSGYLDHPKYLELVKKLEGKEGLSKERLDKLFSSVTRQQGILDSISKPAERTLTWADYRPIFIKQIRIDGGVEFWQQHEDALNRAAKEYQIPPEIIVAIIGVETRYGKFKGKHRVLDALSTLGFDYPPRSKFFYKELEQFLLLEEYAGIDLENTKGSYAGAMGFGQFIPSSYRHYAVDFDDDGKIDLINNPVDAIGSVANYFAVHGWKPGGKVVARAHINQDKYKANKLDSIVDIKGLKPKHKVKEFNKYGLDTNETLDPNQKASAYKLQGADGDEYWLCLDNFYVITRYNHSRLYAMAVYQLSQMIKHEKEFGGIK